MAKYYAIYPILFIVPPTFMFPFLSAGYGAAQNDAKVSSSDSDTVKPVKSMSSGSLWKTMKYADKQAAVFCLWCNSFANENKFLALQHFVWGGCCGKDRSAGPAVARLLPVLSKIHVWLVEWTLSDSGC